MSRHGPHVVRACYINQHDCQFLILPSTRTSIAFSSGPRHNKTRQDLQPSRSGNAFTPTMPASKAVICILLQLMATRLHQASAGSPHKLCCSTDTHSVVGDPYSPAPRLYSTRGHAEGPRRPAPESTQHTLREQLARLGDNAQVELRRHGSSDMYMRMGSPGTMLWIGTTDVAAQVFPRDGIPSDPPAPAGDTMEVLTDSGMTVVGPTSIVMKIFYEHAPHPAVIEIY
ncbi:hypothetical protein SeMB42_g03448 [Synchytrium endobioticum]|nr:hypothetical protein SeMB42_g03448 [Synchytrium endobioticum]